MCSLLSFFKRCRDEFYSIILDSKGFDKFFGKYKKELFWDIQDIAQSEVLLEIGIGNGANFKYFKNQNVSIIGVDPNPCMLKVAEQRAQENDILNFEGRLGTSENLPVDDSSVNRAVVSLVLCSVKDVDKSLKEIERVLKPGGKFYFIEHIISPKSSTKRFFQRIFSPFQQFFAGGCHLDRDLLGSLNKIHLQDLNVTTLDSCCCNLEGPLVVGSAICNKKE